MLLVLFMQFEPLPPSQTRKPWQIKQSFFGAMGCSMAMILSSMGAAYGIAKSGIGISAVSVMRPDMMVRSKCFHPQGRQPLLITSITRLDAANSRWNSIHLRPRGSCDDFCHTQREDGVTHKLHAVRSRIDSGAELFERGVHNRHCWRCGGEGLGTTAQGVCRDDDDAYLCWSSGNLWFDSVTVALDWVGKVRGDYCLYVLSSSSIWFLSRSGPAQELKRSTWHLFEPFLKNTQYGLTVWSPVGKLWTENGRMSE